MRAFCRFCGSRLVSDADYCTQCGAVLKKGEPFAILTKPKTLKHCLFRINALHAERESVSNLVFWPSKSDLPQAVYSTEEGDLFVFNGDLSEDTLTARNGLGFRRQHPIVLKLLEEEVEPIEPSDMGTRLECFR